LAKSSEGQSLNPTTPRKRSDYHRYYHDQCRKLAPRYRAFDHHAFEATLALLMFDYPEKSESECVIALANMELYAPLTVLEAWGPDEER
jgi:hypothetical protein